MGRREGGQAGREGEEAERGGVETVYVNKKFLELTFWRPRETLAKARWADEVNEPSRTPPLFSTAKQRKRRRKKAENLKLGRSLPKHPPRFI